MEAQTYLFYTALLGVLSLLGGGPFWPGPFLGTLALKRGQNHQSRDLAYRVLEAYRHRHITKTWALDLPATAETSL